MAGFKRGLWPAAVTVKPETLSPAIIGSTVRVPPRDTVPAAMTSMLSNSFTRFLSNKSRGKFQVSAVLPSSKSLGRRLVGALLDQLESKCLGLFVFVLLHDFDAVDDRADRADEVMANARAQ
jgi:hypothetical protein